MKKTLILLLLIISTVLCISACDKGDDVDYTESITVTFIEGENQTPIQGSIAWFNQSSFTYFGNVYVPGYRCVGYFTPEGVMYVDENGKKNGDLIFDRNLTLIARYEPWSYHFTFSSGERQFEDGTTEQKTDIPYESAVGNFPEPVNNNPAYYFDGYFSEDGKRYSNGTIPVNSVFRDDDDLYDADTPHYNLTAVYKLRTFTVTVDYNDGSMETDTFTVDYGAAIGGFDAYYKDTGSEDIVGWSSNPYIEAELPEAVTEDLRIYAVWKPYKNINFILPDGEAHVEKIHEDTENRIVLPQLSHPGYKLIGWHITNSLAGNRVESVHYSNMQDTYWGNWQLTDYVLTFNAKGLVYDEMHYYYGDTTVLPIPELRGYSFHGWYVDDPDTAFYSIPETLWGDKELTAKLVPNSYLLTLKPDGGQLVSNFEMVEYDSNYTLPVPTKEGYNFLGWYDAARNGNKLTNARGLGLTSWNIDGENISLYAYWEVKTYVISFNTDGGTTVAPQTYTHGETLSLPSSPKKSGVLFHGWYNEDGTVEYTSKSIVTGAVTIYAKWIQSTPIFDSNGLLAIANDPTLNYHLMDDINMGGIAWTPLAEFSGILDGQGFKIYNLTLSDNATQGNFAFIKTNSGTIRNLNFEDVTYNYSYDGETQGAILTAVNNGLIQNCRITGGKMIAHTSRFDLSWLSPFRVGVFAGDNNGTIEGCYTNTDIDATTTTVANRGESSNNWDYTHLYVGGIVGLNLGTVTECETVQNITATGVVTSGGTQYPWTSPLGYTICHVGGIAGEMRSGKIELCTSSAGVYARYGTLSASSVGAYGVVGGIVGNGCGTGTVDSCYSNGAVHADCYGFNGYVGGFIGSFSSGTVINCYTTSIVTCNSSAHYYGGFAGYINGVVRYCYADNSEYDSAAGFYGFAQTVGASGTVSGCFSTAPSFYGTSEGLLDNCYYASETADGSIKDEKLPSELIRAEFIYDTMYWNESVWLADGLTYPKLAALTHPDEEAEG